MDTATLYLRVLKKDLPKARSATGWPLFDDLENDEEISIQTLHEHGVEFLIEDAAYGGVKQMDALAKAEIPFFVERMWTSCEFGEDLCVSIDGACECIEAESLNPMVQVLYETEEPNQKSIREAQNIIRTVKAIRAAMGKEVG